MVDTRRKIVTTADLPRLAAEIGRSGKPPRVVTGYFDPLVGSHARRLEEIARAEETLIVYLLTPPSALLPARARAELTAALAVVDYVVLPEADDDPLPAWLAALPASQLSREEQADLERRAELLQLIYRKSAVETA